MATRRPTTIVNLASEEVDARGIIENRDYERALILGPAVFALLENVSFISGSFAGDPESMFIEVPQGRRVQGVVGLRNVRFHDCRFENIAIIGPPDMVAHIRSQIQFDSPPAAPDSSGGWPPASPVT